MASGGGVEQSHWAQDEIAADASLVLGRGQHLMTWQNGGQRTTPGTAPAGVAAGVVRIPACNAHPARHLDRVVMVSLASLP